MNLKRVAVISAILEGPEVCQHEFNDIVSEHKSIVKGRMGLPFEDGQIAVIALTVAATPDEINSFNGKLGKIENVTVKTIISKKEIE